MSDTVQTAALQCSLLQQIQSVITSYSIHYTKLYEANTAQVLEKVKAELKQIEKILPQDTKISIFYDRSVITSYSIHYTKLYDLYFFFFMFFDLNWFRCLLFDRQILFLYFLSLLQAFKRRRCRFW